MKRVLQEALIVAAIGAILAFAANGVSPRGLKLGRDHFPGDKASPETAPVTNASATSSVPAAEGLAERFAREGLQLADGSRVSQLFHDPRKQHNLVVFIDARSEEHYQAGHIPGAYQFNRFHPEEFLPTLAPLCQNAEQIVFYCTGGECEDSEHAALEVRDGMGLPKEKIFVYGGGITEWESNGMPVEVGARNSGVITNLPPGNASGTHP